MITTSTLSTILATSFFAVTQAVYFAHRKPEVCLHTASQRGAIVGRVYAYPNTGDNCSNDAVSYELIGTKELVNINSSMGWITLKQDIVTIPNEFKINVSASCLSTSGKRQSDNTTVLISNCSSGIAHNPVDDTCFGHISDDTFRVEENTYDVIIGRLSPILEEDETYTRTYTVASPKNRFSIDPNTSELKVIKALDRDALSVPITGKTPGNITGSQPLKVECQITRSNAPSKTIKKKLKVAVIDINDNPLIYQKNSTQHQTTDVEVGPDTRPMSVYATLIDKDAWVEDAYTLNVSHDPLNVCKPALTCLNTGKGHAACLLNVTLTNMQAIQSTLYKCEVSVLDRGFKPPPNSNTTARTTKLVNIHKVYDSAPTAMSLESNRHLTFYRNATRLARLIQLDRDRTYHGRTSVFMLKHSIFNVTPESGIIYVQNVAALASANDVITFTVKKTTGENFSLAVHMEGSSRKSLCDESCSFHKSTATCQNACAVGLSSGNCVMRGNENLTEMSFEYGTCTYDTLTCPDSFCDELEDMEPLLCPQDCTKTVMGAYIPQRVGERGIKRAQGPCWCDLEYIDIECSCLPQYDHVPPLGGAKDQYTEAGLMGIDSQTVTDLNTNASLSVTALATHQSNVSCGKMCITGIGLGVGAFFLIAFTLFMLWFTKKHNDHRKSNLKHVGSVNSMSGMTSEYYHDEREGRMSYSSEQWSPKRPIYTTQDHTMYSDDGKWEIDREKLSLEKTLGEGEFGLVVKGVLATGTGENNSKYVAVKMLKHCSSQLEEQDLWSEFTLLKDVSHPNVIKLLGACTSGGPFYLVVEFCENGCLLKFLRRSRLDENGYVNSTQRFKSPQSHEQTDQELNGELLTLRDLLSFSWQIAKGMSYLSEIKLVHRDLAARNILVASGKVLKISDFGLTRDVYEADTYLKKSKGRIPVKWLAPESLYAQIYTTRSDIWSYGIVLWEIVTLGAPPYPGIPPERLYNLLIGGYRMDRPEMCPDEMYAVMQKCWKVDAADRPSFATLAGIFDRILQEKTGYLDLSQGNVHVTDLYNKCFRKSRPDAAPVIDRPTSNHEQEIDQSEDTDDDLSESRSNGSPVRTVVNDTYASDAYLVPISSRNNKNIDEDGGCDNCNHMTPLIDMNIHKAENGTHKNDKQPNHVTVSVELVEPLFKKKSETQLPPSKFNKNKQTIYPLLSDKKGTSRCLTSADVIYHHETTQC